MTVIFGIWPAVSMMGPQKLASFARSSERRRWRFGSFAGCGRSWPVVGVVGYHKGNLKKTYIFLGFPRDFGGVFKQLGEQKYRGSRNGHKSLTLLGAVGEWVGRTGWGTFGMILLLWSLLELIETSNKQTCQKGLQFYNKEYFDDWYMRFQVILIINLWTFERKDPVTWYWARDFLLRIFLVCLFRKVIQDPLKPWLFERSKSIHNPANLKQPAIRCYFMHVFEAFPLRKQMPTANL